MKKSILLLSLTTVLALSFTGCGFSAGSPTPAVPAGPIAPVIAENLAPTECPETETTDDPAVSIDREAVCDLGSVQFSLSLPKNWNYEIRSIAKGENITDAIVFRDTAYPNDTFTLTYAPMPGLCGTGVTIEEITLPAGNLSGRKYTETLQTEGNYWFFLTLSDPSVPVQGNTLQLEATIPLEDWESLEADFNSILDTIRLHYTEPTHTESAYTDSTPASLQQKQPLLQEK